MQVPKKRLSLAVVVLLTTTSILAANPKTAANTRVAKNPMMQMPVVAPLFVEAPAPEALPDEPEALPAEALPEESPEAAPLVAALVGARVGELL